MSMMDHDGMNGRDRRRAIVYGEPNAAQTDTMVVAISHDA
jgi:hypothetical protein